MEALNHQKVGINKGAFDIPRIGKSISAEPKNLEYIRKITVGKDELISEREGDRLRIKYETTQTSILPLNYEYKSQAKTKMLLYKANATI